MRHYTSYDIGGQRWVRATWVTGGADPTEVVEWKRKTDDFTLTEFQSVVVADDDHVADAANFTSMQAALEAYHEACQLVEAIVFPRLRTVGR